MDQKIFLVVFLIRLSLGLEQINEDLVVNNTDTLFDEVGEETLSLDLDDDDANEILDEVYKILDEEQNSRMPRLLSKSKQGSENSFDYNKPSLAGFLSTRRRPVRHWNYEGVQNIQVLLNNFVALKSNTSITKKTGTPAENDKEDPQAERWEKDDLNKSKPDSGNENTSSNIDEMMQGTINDDNQLELLNKSSDDPDDAIYNKVDSWMAIPDLGNGDKIILHRALCNILQRRGTVSAQKCQDHLRNKSAQSQTETFSSVVLLDQVQTPQRKFLEDKSMSRNRTSQSLPILDVNNTNHYFRYWLESAQKNTNHSKRHKNYFENNPHLHDLSTNGESENVPLKFNAEIDQMHSEELNENLTFSSDSGDSETVQHQMNYIPDANIDSDNYEAAKENLNLKQLDEMYNDKTDYDNEEMTQSQLNNELLNKMSIDRKIMQLDTDDFSAKPKIKNESRDEDIEQHEMISTKQSQKFDESFQSAESTIQIESISSEANNVNDVKGLKIDDSMNLEDSWLSKHEQTFNESNRPDEGTNQTEAILNPPIKNFEANNLSESQWVLQYPRNHSKQHQKPNKRNRNKNDIRLHSSYVKPYLANLWDAPLKSSSKRTPQFTSMSSTIETNSQSQFSSTESSIFYSSAPDMYLKSFIEQDNLIPVTPKEENFAANYESPIYFQVPKDQLEHRFSFFESQKTTPRQYKVEQVRNQIDESYKYYSQGNVTRLKVTHALKRPLKSIAKPFSTTNEPTTHVQTYKAISNSVNTPKRLTTSYENGNNNLAVFLLSKIDNFLKKPKL